MNFEGDWVFLKTALPDLQTYLLSNEIYWTLRPPSRSPGGNQLPQLTIGNLLLSQARISATARSSSEINELGELAQQIDAVRDEWRANWGQKAGREHSARLNLWQQYLRELRAEPRAHAGYFAREVRNRAILRLLGPEIILGTTTGVPPQEQEQLAMLDTLLKGLTRPAAFCWEAEAQVSFPQFGFWFLYVEPGTGS